MQTRGQNTRRHWFSIETEPIKIIPKTNELPAKWNVNFIVVSTLSPLVQLLTCIVSRRRWYSLSAIMNNETKHRNRNEDNLAIASWWKFVGGSMSGRVEHMFIGNERYFQLNQTTINRIASTFFFSFIILHTCDNALDRCLRPAPLSFEALLDGNNAVITKSKNKPNSFGNWKRYRKQKINAHTHHH